MPAKPSYSHNLPAAIADLEATGAEWIDRRTLEQTLGVSKTVAWRILKQCGARNGPGGALVCRRSDLVASLAELASSGVHRRQILRRTRLDEFLTHIRPGVLANLTPVVRRDQALDLLSTTFRKLPPNVQLTPASLHIDFYGTEDFLRAMGALVYALHNDYEAISGFIEEGIANTPALPNLTV